MASQQTETASLIVGPSLLPPEVVPRKEDPWVECTQMDWCMLGVISADEGEEVGA